MRVHHLTENAEFDLKHTSRGYHHGQYDLAVVAYSGDKVAGWIDYSVYDGEASIQMIEVKPEYARRGLAKQMLLALQDKYPDQEIDWGSLTQDGSKLYQSMKWKKIKGPGYEIAQKLKASEAEQKSIEDEVIAFMSKRQPMSTASPELQKKVERYYDLDSEIRDYNDELEYDNPVYQKIMIG